MSHEQATPAGASRRPAGRAAAAVVRVVGVLASLAGLAWLIRMHWPQVETWLADLGPWAPVAFVAIHALVVPLGFPVSVLGILAGATFGWLPATALLLLAGLIAAVEMYLLARHLLAARVRAWVRTRPRLAHAMALADQDAVWLMVLLRLSPLHYSAVCYLLGAARVRFRPYLWTSLLVLPSAAFQAFVGHAARVVGRGLATDGDLAAGRAVLLIAGLVATAALMLVLGRIARRALALPAAGADDPTKEAP